MATLKQAADEFLAQRRIAVAGVSRTDSGHGANVVYKGLRNAGYEVFAVNPNAEEVEGDPCFHDLKSIPGGVDAVVVGTAPPDSASVVRDCAEQKIQRIWLHRSFGGCSVSDEAANLARQNHGYRRRLPDDVPLGHGLRPPLHALGARLHRRAAQGSLADAERSPNPPPSVLLALGARMKKSERRCSTVSAPVAPFCLL
jgi:predicted CoA-binding protein